MLGKVKRIYFYGYNWPDTSNSACSLGNIPWDYCVPCANLAYKDSKEIDQITANISGHTLTPSVCRRQCAGFTYPSDSQKIELFIF